MGLRTDNSGYTQFYSCLQHCSWIEIILPRTMAIRKLLWDWDYDISCLIPLLLTELKGSGLFYPRLGRTIPLANRVGFAPSFVEPSSSLLRIGRTSGIPPAATLVKHAGQPGTTLGLRLRYPLSDPITIDRATKGFRLFYQWRTRGDMPVSNTTTKLLWDWDHSTQDYGNQKTAMGSRD